MNKNIRLIKPCMLGRAHYEPGTELDINEARAAELIRAGHAEATGNLPALPPRKVETAAAKTGPRRAARLTGRND